MEGNQNQMAVRQVLTNLSNSNRMQLSKSPITYNKEKISKLQHLQTPCFNQKAFNEYPQSNQNLFLKEEVECQNHQMQTNLPQNLSKFLEKQSNQNVLQEIEKAPTGDFKDMSEIEQFYSKETKLLLNTDFFVQDTSLLNAQIQQLIVESQPENSSDQETIDFLDTNENFSNQKQEEVDRICAGTFELEEMIEQSLELIPL